MTDGPSLETYVETRLNLLNELIKDLGLRIENKLQERDLRYQQRFEAQQQAILKSEVATEKRLEGVNEFRQVLTDQTNSLMPRTEVQTMISSLAEKVSRIENRIDQREGQIVGVRENRQNNQASIGLWIALSTAILGIVALVFKFAN